MLGTVQSNATISSGSVTVTLTEAGRAVNFTVNAPVQFLVSGEFRYGKVSSINTGANQITIITPATGTINASTLISEISESEYQAAGAANVFNVLAFGAMPGKSATDNASAIQAAINAAPDGGTIVFPADGGTYAVNEISIDKPLHIIGNGVTLVGHVYAIFAVTAPIVGNLTIEGFTFDWNGAKGTESVKEAFTNGNKRGQNGAGQYPGQIFDVSTLVLERCHFRGSRVSIFSTDLLTQPTVQHCTWGTDDPFTDLWHNAALNIGGNGPRVLHNRFNCYCPTSSNADIIKLYGQQSIRAQIVGNYIKNGNHASLAQLDMYDGGNQALIEGNTFINVQLMRKEQGGIDNDETFISYDKIINNHFEVEAGSLPNAFIHLHGKLSTISGNTFHGDGRSALVAINWRQHEEELHEFGSIWPLAMIITNNMSYNVDRFVVSNGIAGDNTTRGKSIIANNLVWNASSLFLSFGGYPKAEQLAVSGNYWHPTSNPSSQTELLTGDGTIAIGNVVDNTYGTFQSPPIKLGDLTAKKYRSGSAEVSADGVITITGAPDRGAILITSSSAATEAALILYRATSTNGYATILSQTSNIFEADHSPNALGNTEGNSPKITFRSRTNGTLYIGNRRSGARNFVWTFLA